MYIFLFIYVYNWSTRSWSSAYNFRAPISEGGGAAATRKPLRFVMGGVRPPICMMLQDGSSTFSFFSMGASYSLDESRIEGVSGDSPDYDK